MLLCMMWKKRMINRLPVEIECKLGDAIVTLSSRAPCLNIPDPNISTSG